MKNKNIIIMKKVHLLSDEITSKIAAGEVIERPASVVKELLENSLDAGADSIEVRLKQSGKTLIQINDSGSGIEADDIETIFLRHSTSKINKADDLFDIHSLGFRGEALYSIAAVSDIILTSKTAEQSSASSIHIRSGNKIELKPATGKTGTEIQINELFFNTPARKKFLKSDSSELTYILNFFIPYTLLYPNIHFLLTNNDKTILDLPTESNRITRCQKILNLDSGHILEAQKSLIDKKISIKLFLGDINIQRAKKDMQFIFVNQRPVQDKNISFNLNQTYRQLMPDRVYPFFVVMIDLPASEVDVNTHPAKLQVKIKNENLIIGALRLLAHETLMSSSKPKQINQLHTYKLTKESIYSKPAQPSLAENSNFQYTLNQPSNYPEQAQSQPDISLDKFQNVSQKNLKNQLAQSRYIGSFIKKYLIFETESSLLFIDQHAAQERITFESLLKQIAGGNIETQKLLTPFTIKLSTQEMLVWEKIKDHLEKIGFSTNLWDKESIALQSHPVLIKELEISLRNLLNEDQKEESTNENLARRACRSSLMTGYDVGPTQAQYLKEQLLKCKNSFICPHGRPTVIEIQEKLLNKQFLR